MKNMSFALTKEQILNQTKTVTRRLGWKNLKVDSLIQPVEKCMGFKKGEKVKKLGCPIRVVHVWREQLWQIQEYKDDIIREGFPDLTTYDFIKMFIGHMKCGAVDYVTRIEFDYTVPKQEMPG